MTNPFGNPDRQYLVLCNGVGEHSLWPESLDVPTGWTIVHGAADRGSCLGYVDEMATGRSV